MAEPDIVEKILQKKDALVRDPVHELIVAQLQDPTLTSKLFTYFRNLSDDEILDNAATLLVAGSETTATLLAGLTYHLCKHLEPMRKLKREVRSKFMSDSEITLTAVLELKDLLACLDEALRFYPPVPIGPLRTVPAGLGGGIIASDVVPGGTYVAVWHWPMFHYSKHWEKPMGYRPERFLHEDSPPGPRYAGDMRYNNTNEIYSGDRLDLLQPFNLGPRNFLGRNLAYSEMRLVMARMIFNFDMELVEPKDDWMGKKRADFLWHKRPVHVHLSPADV